MNETRQDLATYAYALAPNENLYWKSTGYRMECSCYMSRRGRVTHLETPKTKYGLCFFFPAAFRAFVD